MHLINVMDRKTLGQHVVYYRLLTVESAWGGDYFYVTFLVYTGNFVLPASGTIIVDYDEWFGDQIDLVRKIVKKALRPAHRKYKEPKLTERQKRILQLGRKIKESKYYRR